MRLFAFLLPLLLTASATAQDGSVAVRAGTVMLADGTTIENGTVVVQDGRITAIGVDVEIPFDVILHEAPDGVLFAGFHEVHTSSGLDRPNENVPIAPFLHVRDSIDPVSFFFEDELRNGTVALGVIPGNNTVLGGRGLVVAPHGLTVEQMMVHADMGMKLAIGPKPGWSRAAQLAELREAVLKLEADLRVLGQAKLDGDAAAADARRAAGDEEEDDAVVDDQQIIRFGEDFPGKAELRAADLNDPQLGLVEMLNGDVRLWVWAPKPTDVMHALRWLGDHGLKDNAVLVVTASAWRAADLIAESGCGIALSGSMWSIERDPVTWKDERTFAPTVFEEAGITFAVGSEKGRMGPDRLGYQASVMIREGVSRAVALAAVTSAPAELWGVGDRLGKLAEGASGTFVLCDGDPLAAGSNVLHVWLSGEHVYDRSKDERLQRLISGEQE